MTLSENVRKAIIAKLRAGRTPEQIADALRETPGALSDDDPLAAAVLAFARVVLPQIEAQRTEAAILAALARLPDTPPDNGEKYLSVRQVAHRLGKHFDTVYRWIRAGKIPAERLNNGVYWILAEDLAKMKRSGPGRPRKGTK